MAPKKKEGEPKHATMGPPPKKAKGSAGALAQPVAAPEALGPPLLPKTTMGPGPKASTFVRPPWAPEPPPEETAGVEAPEPQAPEPQAPALPLAVQHAFCNLARPGREGMVSGGLGIV